MGKLKLCIDYNKCNKWKRHRLNSLRDRIRTWLGINKISMQLHDTRQILFSLQDTVDGKGARLRDRVRITLLEDKEK